MKIQLSAPSKTFLLGEYLVLEGGPALLAATKPRFVLTGDSRGRGRQEGIHPSSPAGRFMADRPEVFSRWDLSFTDPHEGLGGFGASSAQFIFAYTLEKLSVGAIEARALKNAFHHLSVEEMWRTYRRYADVGGGWTPSGADVIGQVTGGLARVTISPVITEAKTWNFANYGFYLVRTGRKVLTHAHLKKLEDIQTDGLQAAFQVGEKALAEGDGELFASAVTLYHAALLELDLVAHEANELIEALASTEAVAAVKGCGALGADVLFLLYEKPNEAIVRDRLNLLQLNIVASDQDLTEGLRLTIDKTRMVMKGATL